MQVSHLKHVGSITVLEGVLEDINMLKSSCRMGILNRMVPFIRSDFTFPFLSHFSLPFGWDAIKYYLTCCKHLLYSYNSSNNDTNKQ